MWNALFMVINGTLKFTMKCNLLYITTPLCTMLPWYILYSSLHITSAVMLLWYILYIYLRITSAFMYPGVECLYSIRSLINVLCFTSRKQNPINPSTSQYVKRA